LGNSQTIFQEERIANNHKKFRFFNCKWKRFNDRVCKI